MTDEQRLAAAREKLEQEAGVTSISADGIAAKYDPAKADEILSKGLRRVARAGKRRPLITTINLQNS